MSGFIIMHRSALDHPILKDAAKFHAWFWLIANAAWKPTRARVKGKVITLERGELTYSVRFLAEAWGWSKSRVDRFISELRAEGMISTRSKIGTPGGTRAGHNAGQGQSIITISNYDKYQDNSESKRDKGETETEPHTGTTAGQQRDKEEQGNKGTSIPVSNDTGAADLFPAARPSAEIDPDKAFWDSAKAYLGKSKASLIGRWVKSHGRETTANAITAAQINRAVDPIPYIERTLRKARADEWEFTGPC